MPEIFLPRIASHTIRGFFVRKKEKRGLLAATDGRDGQNGQNGQDGQKALGAASRGAWCRLLAQIIEAVAAHASIAFGGVQRGAPRPLWCRSIVAALLGSGTLPPVGSTGAIGCGWRISPISPISPISQEPLGAASKSLLVSGFGADGVVDFSQSFFSSAFLFP